MWQKPSVQPTGTMQSRAVSTTSDNHNMSAPSRCTICIHVGANRATSAKPRAYCRRSKASTLIASFRFLPLQAPAKTSQQMNAPARKPMVG